MHELSLCRSILDIADRGRGGRVVEAVNLRVGHLRQVVPETLVHCWALVTPGTGLEGSRLAVEHVPISLRCKDCDAVTEVEHALLISCAACGSGRVEVLTGEELLVPSLDLAPRAACRR